jgi:hypothetical protein
MSTNFTAQDISSRAILDYLASSIRYKHGPELAAQHLRLTGRPKMSFTKKLNHIFSGLIFLAIGGFSLPSSANLMQIDLGFSTNTSEGFRVINAHLVYDDRAYTIENRSSQIQVTTFNSFAVDLSIGSNQNGVFSYAPYAATLDPASELRWTLYRETDPQGNLVYNRTNLYLNFIFSSTQAFESGNAIRSFSFTGNPTPNSPGAGLDLNIDPSGRAIVGWGSLFAQGSYINYLYETNLSTGARVSNLQLFALRPSPGLATPVSVPLPMSLLLLSTGLLGVWAWKPKTKHLSTITS